MRIHSREVTTSVVEDFTFETNDIVIDGMWFSVGIRVGYGDKARWYFTPYTVTEESTVRVLTDEEVKAKVKSKAMMYLGKYHDLWDEAGEKNSAAGIYDIKDE